MFRQSLPKTGLVQESGGEDSENQSSAANRSLCTSGMCLFELELLHRHFARWDTWKASDVQMRYSFQRLVGFALAPLGLLLLVLAALDGWKWGIGLAVCSAYPSNVRQRRVSPINSYS
eukprot:2657123-Rhodomonas_salina.5